MHVRLLPAVQDVIRDLKPARVLDVGCGSGHFTEQLRILNKGVQFSGIEPDASGIVFANKAFPQIDSRLGSLYDSPPDEWCGAFDLVISTEVVEHLYDPRAMPKFIHAVLRPGGSAVVTTPYHGYWKNLALSLLNKWDAHHTVFWADGHIKFWSEKTLGRLFREAGFIPRRFKGIGRVPYLWMTMLMVFEKKQVG